MKKEDVLRAFDQAQGVLVAKYGTDKLFAAVMNPLIVGANITEEEYVRRASDAKFIERIELSEILMRILDYRQRRAE